MLSGRGKGIADPHDGCFSHPVEQQTVEATVALPVRARAGRQVMSCGKNDTALFDGGDAGGRTTMAHTTTQADFHEHQRPSVPADQVDLAATATIVARDDRQTLSLEEACGQPLGDDALADRMCR